MTELEKIEYAKSFIDKLADGINPLDDTPIPDDGLINHVRISRCLFYVSGILQGEIDKERGRKPKKTRTKRLPFSVTQEQLQAFEYSSYPITAPAISRKINWLVKEEIAERKIKKFSYRKIYYWLHEIGMVEWRSWYTGKSRRFPTPKGEAIGLSLEVVENYGKEAPVIYFSEEAQRFIINHFDAVMAAERGTASPMDREGDGEIEAEAEAEAEVEAEVEAVCREALPEGPLLEIPSQKEMPTPQKKTQTAPKTNAQAPQAHRIEIYKEPPRDPSEEIRVCRNCRFQVFGECSSWDPCDDFQPVYHVPKAELDYWPTEGDATRLKQRIKKSDWEKERWDR